MAYLILIRHSITRQQPDVSSHEWTLTDEGRARCKILAEQLRPFHIDVLYSSQEMKARLTAALVARELTLPVPEAIDGLHETLRHTAPYVKDMAEFQALIKSAMLQPDDVVFGEEAFTAARARFDATVHRLLKQHPDRTVAVVTHGTVMSLYIAWLTRIEAYPLWQSLDMPAYAVFLLPELFPTKLIPTVVEP